MYSGSVSVDLRGSLLPSLGPGTVEALAVARVRPRVRNRGDDIGCDASVEDDGRAMVQNRRAAPAAMTSVKGP